MKSSTRILGTVHFETDSKKLTTTLRFNLISSFKENTTKWQLEKKTAIVPTLMENILTQHIGDIIINQMTDNDPVSYIKKLYNCNRNSCYSCTFSNFNINAGNPLKHCSMRCRIVASRYNKPKHYSYSVMETDRYQKTPPPKATETREHFEQRAKKPVDPEIKDYNGNYLYDPNDDSYTDFDQFEDFTDITCLEPITYGMTEIPFQHANELTCPIDDLPEKDRTLESQPSHSNLEACEAPPIIPTLVTNNEPNSRVHLYSSRENQYPKGSATVQTSFLHSERKLKSLCDRHSTQHTAKDIFGPENHAIFKNGSTNTRTAVYTLYYLPVTETLLELRQKYMNMAEAFAKRLETFVAMPNTDICFTEAALAGFIAKAFIYRETESNSELLCLECCIVLENLPRNTVLIAAHKLYSKTCKFVSELRRTPMTDVSGLDSTDSIIDQLDSISSGLTITHSMVQRKDHHTMNIQHMDTKEEGYKEAVAALGDYLPSELSWQLGRILRQLAGSLPDDSLELLGIVRTAEGLNKMAEEDKRMESFKTFINDLFLDPQSLAKAGFFWTGMGNVMQCFACGKCHSEFEKSTDPMIRHLQISPGCAFMQRSFTPEYLKQLRELGKTTPYEPPEPTLLPKSSGKKVAKWLDINPYRKIIENAGQFSNGQRGNETEYIRGLLYECVDRKLQCQEQIPSTEPEIIEMLIMRKSKQREKAQAMPFNDGSMSQVKCSFDNDLLSASARLERQSRLETTRALQRQQASNTPNINVAEVAEAMRCKICLDKLCSLLLLPCTHIATCAACGMSQADCPICRSPIKATVSVKF